MASQSGWICVYNEHRPDDTIRLMAKGSSDLVIGARCTDQLHVLDRTMTMVHIKHKLRWFPHMAHQVERSVDHAIVAAIRSSDLYNVSMLSGIKLWFEPKHPCTHIKTLGPGSEIWEHVFVTSVCMDTFVVSDRQNACDHLKALVPTIHDNRSLIQIRMPCNAIAFFFPIHMHSEVMHPTNLARQYGFFIKQTATDGLALSLQVSGPKMSPSKSADRDLHTIDRIDLILQALFGQCKHAALATC